MIGRGCNGSKFTNGQIAHTQGVESNKKTSLIKTIDNGIMLWYEMFYEDLLCACCGGVAGFNGEVCDVNTHQCVHYGLFVQSKQMEWWSVFLRWSQVPTLSGPEGARKVFLSMMEGCLLKSLNLIIKVDISDVPPWYKCDLVVVFLPFKNQQYDNMGRINVCGIAKKPFKIPSSV